MQINKGRTVTTSLTPYIAITTSDASTGDHLNEYGINAYTIGQLSRITARGQEKEDTLSPSER